MSRTEAVSAFRPAVSPDDWNMILSAIGAYAHNSTYRDLLGRLERQAVINGIAVPSRRPS
jgi:hypothetical protein